ncbi:MAG: glycosyl transferase, partial [bacterium]
MHTVQKILIIRFSSLGDIVLATPLISRLRKKFPEAQVDFLIRIEYAELLQFNPKINNLIRF